MNNGLGYKLANVPTITGLSTITADAVISDTLIINGVDISTTLTGITYSNAGGIDLTTIDNNLTITSGKKIKCATVPTNNDDVTNKLYVDTAISNLIDAAPATLDTLNELAASLNDDANFATTVTNLIAGKVSLTAPETISGAKTFSNTTTFGDVITFNGATSSLRQINNSVYNFYDLTAVAGGVLKGKLYSNSTNLIFDLEGATIFSVFMTGAFESLKITKNDFILKCNNCPTIIGFTDPIASDSSNKIASTRWVQSAITASATTAATTIAVADNDTSTTMYPIFTTATAGQKSLLFDSTTTPLRYKPDTSELSAQQFTVNGFNTVAGDNAGLISQNIGSVATVIQNQATSGKIFLNTRNALSNSINVVQLSTTDMTITTTNCPTITGFTAPATSDNTSKIATTSWVQSVITTGLPSSTVAVADDNTATTMFPIFTTTGAGQKSLLFDITTSPFSYTPSTGTLRALIYSSTTTTTTISGTTVSIIGDPVVQNRNIVVNNTNGVQRISIGSGGTNSNSCIIITDGTNVAATNNFSVSGAGNTVVGVSAGSSMITTNFDATYVGCGAASSSTGYGNTCIGRNAGSAITTGFLNTCIGQLSSVPSATGNNQIGIGSTSDTIYIRGGFNFRIGTLITNNITLPTASLPLAQHYPVAMSAASLTITLPVPTDPIYLGATLTFKRRTNTTAFTLAAGAGTPFLSTSSITGTATFVFGTTLFQATLVCDGVRWNVVSQA